MKVVSIGFDIAFPSHKKILLHVGTHSPVPATKPHDFCDPIHCFEPEHVNDCGATPMIIVQLYKITTGSNRNL